MCLRLLRQSTIAGLKPSSSGAAVADQCQATSAAWQTFIGIDPAGQSSSREKGDEATTLAHSHSLALLSPSR